MVNPGREQPVRLRPARARAIALLECAGLMLGITLTAGALGAGFVQKPDVAMKAREMSGNPVIEGWYADPEAIVYGRAVPGSTRPTRTTTRSRGRSTSRRSPPRQKRAINKQYLKQTFFDAFSSERPGALAEAPARAGHQEREVGGVRPLGAVGHPRERQVLPVLRAPTTSRATRKTAASAWRWRTGPRARSWTRSASRSSTSSTTAPSRSTRSCSATTTASTTCITAAGGTATSPG